MAIVLGVPNFRIFTVFGMMKILFSTIPTPDHDLQVKATDLKFYVTILL